MANNKKTWAELRMEELMAKGRSNWDEDDWDSYNYIKECEAEDERDAEYLSSFGAYY